MSGWRTDMENAPKFGERVLLYVPDTEEKVFASQFECGAWQGLPWRANPFRPTHWQPIPEPPQ